MGHLSNNTRKTVADRMYVHAIAILQNEFSFVKEEFHHKDVFGYNPGGASCEIEIKVNDYDFYKEFNSPKKKFKHKHYSEQSNICPTRFYFFVPRNLMVRALRKMENNPWYNKYGLIIYDYFMDAYKIVKKSEVLSDSPFIGEILDTPFRDYKHKRVSI